jgi:hypothetical protein
MLTGGELGRLQDHLLLLIKNATERVAAFLLDLADRVPTGNSVELTMSRQGIADYLGLDRSGPTQGTAEFNSLTSTLAILIGFFFLSFDLKASAFLADPVKFSNATQHRQHQRLRAPDAWSALACGQTFCLQPWRGHGLRAYARRARGGRRAGRDQA